MTDEIERTEEFEDLGDEYCIRIVRDDAFVNVTFNKMKDNTTDAPINKELYRDGELVGLLTKDRLPETEDRLGETHAYSWFFEPASHTAHCRVLVPDEVVEEIPDEVWD